MGTGLVRAAGTQESAPGARLPRGAHGGGLSRLGGTWEAPRHPDQLRSPSPPEPVPGPQRVEGEAGAQPAPSEAGVFKDQASGTQCPGLQDRFGGSSDPRRGSQGGPSPRQLHQVTPTPVRGLLCKVQQEDKSDTHPPRPSQAAVDLASCPNPASAPESLCEP